MGRGINAREGVAGGNRNVHGNMAVTRDVA